tara:strand:- start:212 stop:385 length:174 start_codon:yes stop_codon:yes gene_type:complete
MTTQEATHRAEIGIALTGWACVFVAMPIELAEAGMVGVALAMAGSGLVLLTLALLNK